MCELDSLACGYPLSQHHLLKDHSFTIGVSWCPCRKSTDHTCMGLFLDIQFFSIGLGIHPNACTTLSWLIPNLQQHWKSKCDSDLFSLQKKLCVCVCVAILNPFHFHMNLRSSLFLSSKNQLGLWQGLCWIYRSIWGVLPSQQY